MFVRDHLGIAGSLTIRQYTKENQFVKEVRANNDITLAGRNLVARLFNDSEADPIGRVSKIKLGTSGAPFDETHTELVQYLGETSITLIEPMDFIDGNSKNRKMLRLTGELTENDSNGELREAGLFTSGTPEVMYNRVTFDTITKSDQFKLTLIWEIVF